MLPEPQETHTAHWPASLTIELSLRSDKTVPSSIKHFGPLRVQRPFYPEKDGCCHLYILHPPGGVVGGDSLLINVLAGEKSQSLLTTPGATKVYRSTLSSKIEQSLIVQNNAILEWMPQETILFSGAKTTIKTNISFSQNSQLFFQDIICLGLPSNDLKFRAGSCQQSLEFSCDGTSILIENTLFDSNTQLLSANWGLRNYYISAIAVMTSNDAAILDKIRLATDDFSSSQKERCKIAGDASCAKDSKEDDPTDSYKKSLFGVTAKQGLIICRYMGNSVEEAKEYFQHAWSIWRKIELEKKTVAPRIWAT